MAKVSIKNNEDSILLIRLILASLLCIICLFVKFNNTIIFILCLISAAIAGYDIVIASVRDIKEKNFISSELLSTVAVLGLFILKLYTEAAAAFLLFRIGIFIIEISKQKSIDSTITLMAENDNSDFEATKKRAEPFFSDIINAQTKSSQYLYEVAKKISIALVIVSLVYLIFAFIFSDNTATLILHRVCVMIFLASTSSVLIALPYNAIVGIGISEINGFQFQNYSSFRNFSNLSTVVFEREGIISSNELHVSKIHSDLMDSEVLLKIAAHILYNSNTPEALAVRAAYNGIIDKSITNDFREAPGIGSEIIINGVALRIGTSKLYKDGPIVIPSLADNRTMYLSMANRYLGYITFEETVLSNPQQLTAELNKNNIRNILVSSSGNAECSNSAKLCGIKQYYSNCSVEDMLRVIEDIRSKQKGNVLFVHSSDLHQHSAANIDGSYNIHTKYSDALISEKGLFSINREIVLSKKAKKISIINIAFSSLIKLALYILAMFGIGNLWFAVVIDALVSIASILSSIQIGIDIK
jgi:cation transport ATPase